jgi:peptide/nickel transport system permease protein
MTAMRDYALRKVIYLLVTLMVIIAFNFFLFRIMPGDIASTMIPKGINDEVRKQIEAYFNLDKPWYEQFVLYIQDVFTLDFGVSATYRAGIPVVDVLGSKIVNTVILVGIGTILAIYLGVAVGKMAGWNRGKMKDTVGMSFALVFYSMPTFLFALVLLMIFSGTLGWFPERGAVGQLPWNRATQTTDELGIANMIISRAYHLCLPVVAFTLEILAEFALITRNALTDVLTEDYITTARAKGLSNYAVLNDHAMRNAMLPVVTIMAISIGWVLGGTIMVEIVFSYDGLGLLTYDAVLSKDFPLLQVVFLIMAIAVLICNFVADIVYFYLDPRVKV